MYIIESIAISLDRVSKDVDSGFKDRFTGGFDGQFNGWFDGGSLKWFNGGFNGQFDLAVLGYQPQRSVWQLRREAKQSRYLKLVFPASLNKLVVLQAFKGY